MKNFVKFIPVLFLIGVIACKKDKKNDPDPEPTTPPSTSQTGSLKINFENMVDTNELVFGDPYVNAQGDTFTINKFNYYISNIIITKDDNSTYAESNSYHLVKHSNAASTILTLANVPVGSYKSLSFVLGIDSTRNVSGAQTGDLDPVTASDMYWSWNTGYIFVKLEGTSPKSGATDKSLTFHIGGGGGVNKAQRNFNLSFGNVTADVTTAATPLVHLSVDASELFKTPNPIDFSASYSQMASGPSAKIYADNYADMIQFEHVHNN